MYKIGHLGYLENNHKTALKRWKQNGYKISFKEKKDLRQNIICSLLKKKNFPDVELISVLDKRKKSTIKNRIKRGIHFDHVCYLVNNFDKEIAVLRKENFKLVYKAWSSIFKTRIAFLISSNNSLIELMQK